MRRSNACALATSAYSASMRTGSIQRNTAETAILIEVNLDGTGRYDVSTGIGFLDHMVEQFAKHSLIDVTMKVTGDLHVDQHHTTEDSALALSERLSGVFDRLTKQGALSEDDVKTALREVRVALLEADVSLPVARDFVTAVQAKATGHRRL